MKTKDVMLEQFRTVTKYQDGTEAEKIVLEFHKETLSLHIKFPNEETHPTIRTEITGTQKQVMKRMFINKLYKEFKKTYKFFVGIPKCLVEINFEKNDVLITADVEYMPEDNPLTGESIVEPITEIFE